QTRRHYAQDLQRDAPIERRQVDQDPVVSGQDRVRPLFGKGLVELEDPRPQLLDIHGLLTLRSESALCFGAPPHAMRARSFGSTSSCARPLPSRRTFCSRSRSATRRSVRSSSQPNTVATLAAGIAPASASARSRISRIA